MLNITASRRAKKNLVELNIAPLIDMVFILLIFFLVNTSFVKEAGIEVNRPSATTAELQKKAAIMVAVDRENRIFMEGREIDIRAVRANVERALAENPEGGVVVISDKISNAGVVISVMDGCRMAGAENISLAATVPQK
ncbi:MAG: biopolymer transporter ExbD [Desulfobulbaceae bacterium]|nr:biopolymer transporter ExbD [Desulfobulbaceae bacterium]